MQTEVDVLLATEERTSTDSGAFKSEAETIDARERALASIVRRRGQGAFRDSLIAAYGAKCAITGFDAVEALEAAQITPYLGPHTNDVANGILLRGDVHTLLDLGLLAVNEDSLQVIISPALAATRYEELQGSRVHVPADRRHQPSRDALARHRAWAGL